jgi:hypothetical protein
MNLEDLQQRARAISDKYDQLDAHTTTELAP